MRSKIAGSTTHSANQRTEKGEKKVKGKPQYSDEQNKKHMQRMAQEMEDLHKCRSHVAQDDEHNDANGREGSKEWAEGAANGIEVFEKRDDEEYHVVWTKSNHFKGAVGFIVIINAVVLGVEADYGTQAPGVFMALEHCFCALFAFELLVHFKVEGPRDYFSDRMNWLDFVLVAMSIADVWIIAPLKINVDLKVLSIFRILRLTRMVRMIKLIQIFKELTIMVEGLAEAMSTLFWALFFLLILIYSGSLIFRHIIGKAYSCEHEGSDGTCSGESDFFYEFNPDIGDQGSLFGGIDKTMLTLFCCITEGCGMEIIRPTVTTTPSLVMLWLPFIGLTAYGVLTLIVAIVCETCLQNSAANDRDIMVARAEMNKHGLVALCEAFSNHHHEDGQMITQKEFWEGLDQDESVGQQFIELGLHKEEGLFKKLDAEDVGSIPLTQFFDGLYLTLQGQQCMMAKDVVGPHLLLQAVQGKMSQINEEIESVQRFNKLEKHELQSFLRLQSRIEVKLGRFQDQIKAITEDLVHLKSRLVKPRHRDESLDSLPDAREQSRQSEARSQSSMGSPRLSLPFASSASSKMHL